MLVLGASGIQAQIWNGAGTNDFWITGSNWVGTASPANNGTATVIFGGTTRLTPYADVNWDILGLTFSNTAGAFTLGGNQLTVRGSGIVNNDADLQTLNNNIILGAAQNWNAASGNLYFGGTVANGGYLLTINGANNTTLNGVFSGTGGLTQSGTGTLTLNGVNTFSGALTLGAGTLAVGNDSATGTGGFTISGGTIQASGSGTRIVSNVLTNSGNFTIGGSQNLSFTNNIYFTADRTITVNNSGVTTFSGQLGQTAASPKFTKAGTGTLVLSASNALTDTITVSAGVLNIQNANALGTTAQGTIVNSGGALEVQGGIAVGAEALELNGSGISGGGALRNVSGNNSIAGALTFGSATTIASDSGSLTLSGTLNNGGKAITLTGAGDFTLSGLVSGTGTMTKDGAGSLTLSGTANNTVSGVFSLNAGTLLLNKTAGIHALDTLLTVGDGLGGANADVVRWLANDQMSSGGGTEITVKSSGWLDLNGYSDTIKLDVMEGGKVTTSTGTLTLAGPVTYSISGTNTAYIYGNVDLGANRDFHVYDGTQDEDLVIEAILSGAYDLKKKNQAGRFVLTGTNTYSGATTVEGGVLNIRNGSALGATSSGTTVNDGAALEMQGGIAVGTEALTVTGTGISNGGALRNASGNNSWAGNITLGGAATTFASDSGTLTISGNVDNATRDLTLAGAGNISISGVLSDTGDLIKTGAGTAKLSGANTYSGATTISNGVLNIQNSAGLGATSSGTTVRSGGELQLQGGISVGAETLSLNGSGASSGGALRNISGNNSYAGAVTLGSASTIASDSGTLTISGTVANGGFTNSFAGSGDVTVSGVISGTGSLVKNGSGTLALNATNTFSGGATINAGTVSINNASSLGSTNIAATINQGTLRATETITGSRNFTLGASNSTIEVDGSKIFTVNGIMSGTGGLVKTGNGTLIVGGANTFSGNLNINAGTLQLGAANRIGNSVAVGLNGGTLNSGGYNETVGALTLTENSIIDLGAGASVLHFDDSSAIAWTAGKALTITNWNGTFWTGGGTDQIYFGSNSNGLTSSQLAQIRFVDPNGVYQPVAILSNGEIVPVPEPATVIAVVLVVGLVLYRERRLVGVLWLRLSRGRDQGRAWNASLPGSGR